MPNLGFSVKSIYWKENILVELPFKIIKPANNSFLCISEASPFYLQGQMIGIANWNSDGGGESRIAQAQKGCQVLDMKLS